MKGMKRVMTCLLTAALTLGATTAVFATETTSSSETTSTSTTVSTAVELGSKEAKVESLTKGVAIVAMDTDNIKDMRGVSKETVDAINDVNAGEVTVDEFIKEIEGEKGALKVKEAIAGKDFLTGFFDVRPANNDDDDPIDDKGYYTVKIGVDTLKEGMTDVQVLHYSLERGVWEVLIPEEVNLEEKYVIVKFADLSPAAMVVAKAPVPTATPTVAPTEAAKKDSKTAKADAKTATKASTTSKTAPKTGVSTNYMAWMVAAMAFIGAAFAVSRKKATM